MKIKSRLLIAFLTITTLPIILVTIAAFTIVKFQEFSIEETYDLESDTLLIISNPLNILNNMTRDVYNEIVITAEETPEKFENSKYINDLNVKLKDRFSYIIVRKGEDVLYSGNTKELEFIEHSLPKFGEYQTDVEGGLYVAGIDPTFLKQEDFYYSDGSEGSIFIISDGDAIMPQIRSTAIQIIFAFVFVIIFLAGALIYWIYRSILAPLEVLRQATDAMKEGNLDYAIVGDPSDEIGKLCYDFDEMRLKFKELFDFRLKHEEEFKELISNISHDLKTPITSIKGYAEGIIDGVADTNEKQNRYIKTIYAKASDMSVLVDELSLYSKIDYNTMNYCFSYVNLNSYFQDCIDELSFDLELKGINVIFKNHCRPNLEVTMDGEQLKRVINNIIGNAVKYMNKRNCYIELEIREGENYVIVAISDNGVGIPTKDLAFIFDRFYRVDASRNTAKGGSGLGLAISKKIIQAHSGDIWATSEEDMGTTIFFTLKKRKE